MPRRAVPEAPRYTREDLRHVAAERGFTVGSRLINDWVEEGLLDSPERRSLGRGRGQLAATWPEAQLQLLLVLLKHRSTLGRKHLRPLFNIPVGLWAIWGDGYVPLRQLRRALRSWCERSAAGSIADGERIANDLARAAENRGASANDRREFAAELARQFSTGRFDRERLKSKLQAVLDPTGSGEPLGPLGAWMTPDSYLDLIEVRYAAVARLCLKGSAMPLTDAEFLAARLLYQSSWDEYARDQPGLAADAMIGRFFEGVSMEVRVNTVCRNLVTIIGLQEKRHDIQ
jgi:hypothetical protein